METHCIRFGCRGKCSYLHACYVCDSKDHGKLSITGFVLNSNLSDNGDVMAGSSRPAPSHVTIQGFHSLNETKVFQSEGNLVSVNDPQILIDSNNPPLAGFEPSKRPKVDVKNT